MDDSINTRTAKKGIALETTLTATGHINCWSPLGSGRAHTVHVGPTGQINKCTCKGWAAYGYCYHTDALRANHRPLLAAARATSAAHEARETRQALTDGGEVAETCARCPTRLSDVHARHKATVVTTDGEELCPDCGDSRSGDETGFRSD